MALYALVAAHLLLMNLEVQLSINAAPASVYVTISAMQQATHTNSITKIEPEPLTMAVFSAKYYEGAFKKSVFDHWSSRHNEHFAERAIALANASNNGSRMDLILDCLRSELVRNTQIRMVNTLCKHFAKISTINKDYSQLSRYDPDNFMPFGKSFDQLVKRGNSSLYARSNAVISERDGAFNVVLGGTIENSMKHVLGSLIVSADKYTNSAKSVAWTSSILMTNGTLTNANVVAITRCLWIVDSNLVLDQDLRIRDSILITNGDLRFAGSLDASGCFISAAGKIAAVKRTKFSDSFVRSDTSIETPKGVNFPEWKGHNPFRIKFFQLADLGVTAKLHAKGAEITALSPFSPLRLFGLRIGDVVTKVDDRAIDSPDALRRASRTAYVREAGVYYLLRNGQALDRIVLFSDYRLP